MQDEGVFNDLYKRLNRAQKEAVDTIEGPVMVVAGPGTGKTQILTLRVANILKITQTPPDAILALTFTEAGVYAMRKRLAEIIGAGAYGVPIFTFHGFCNDVIGRFPEHFPELIGSRPTTTLDQINIMQKVLTSTKLEILASYRNPFYYLEKVLRVISLLKREDISPVELDRRLDDELARIVSAPDYRHDKGAHKGKVKSEYQKMENSVVKNRELSMLYKKYEEELGRQELYDFDDMILFVVRKLETDEDLRLMLQEEYQYILADEHQDANGAQNKVLEYLSSFHDSPNIFIVGDSKQAIYRFQGASLENFQYFRKLFPSAKLINLEENYRSTQSILDTAYKLMSDNNVVLRAKAGHKEKKIVVNEYDSIEHEARSLAEEIKLLIVGGTKPESITIFTRTNGEISLYADALVRVGVPIAVNTNKDALDDIDIEKLLILIKSAAKIGEDEWLVKALHLSCFDVSELDIFMLVRLAAKKKISLWSLLKNEEEIMSIGLSGVSEVLRVYKLIEGWAKIGANISPADLISTIAEKSGLLAEIISKTDAEEKLSMVALLLDYLKEFVKTKRNARLVDLAELIETFDKYDILEANVSGRAGERVQIMTAHKSKGLEFDHVFIVGVTEGNWSGGRSRSDFKIPGLVSVSKEDEESDDRRLFYVVLTRAKKELSISYGKTKDRQSALLPSRFIDDLPVELLIRHSIKDKADLSVMAESLKSLPKGAISRDDLKIFVRETLSDRGLSVTGLNNYLKCPWQYFYRVLLRVPQTETIPLMFGNAIHAALKIYFDSFAAGNEILKSEVLKRFEYELAKQPLTDKDLQAGVKDGCEALSGYLDHYAGNFEKNIKNELPVDVVMDTGGFDLRLTGKLDKVEFLDANNVVVVDYKTGKTKTRNEIEGKTKDADGDYKRQLVFYNILLNKYNDGLYRMKSGVIDFIMPDDNGRYHREEFVIDPQEVSDLEEIIRQSVADILALSFWDKKCDDKECDYCKLRDMMS